ncbi:conserved hypothetical protein [Gluconacetobacter diazotrophicus PA1 5]|uniref:hypothetical protein n=1 Tax=Gluconacetobacter diazotrophicus TaxID=33996 RepID=UPI000173D8A1|nr:hypothetical protein [Gluconacetobacter diazotrophicus]ACI50258.1 conserved hypothetical protein [Gluconacetobacter diazotrophicus PA1 5]TWB07987.1 hypothetical protein FBZ86_1085 [Gluconacetobacter diazotrophicus]
MARPFASFTELSAPLVGRKTGINHDLQDRLAVMDARALRIMELAGIRTHTHNGRDIYRISEVTLIVEKMPQERLRRTLLIPSQAYGIRRERGDELRFYAENHMKTPLCSGTFTCSEMTPIGGDLVGDMKRLRGRIGDMLRWCRRGPFSGYGFDVLMLANDFAFQFHPLTGVSVNGHVNYCYTMKSPMPPEVWEDFRRAVREKFDLGFYVTGPVTDLSALLDYMTKLYKAERTRTDEILFSDLSDDVAAWFLGQVDQMWNLTPLAGFKVFRASLKTDKEKVVRKRAVPVRKPVRTTDGRSVDALVPPRPREHSLVVAKRLSPRILAGADDSPFPPGFTEGPPRVRVQDQHVSHPVYANYAIHSDIASNREAAAASPLGATPPSGGLASGACPSPGNSVLDQGLDGSVYANSANGSDFATKKSRGHVENLVIARERSSPTEAGIWETWTQVMNLTLRPETEEGERGLAILLRHHEQATAQARRNGWTGRVGNPLARLAAGLVAADSAEPHIPDDQSLFMHANSATQNDIKTIPETIPTSPPSLPDAPPSSAYSHPSAEDVAAARSVLPPEVLSRGLPDVYLVMLANGQRREAEIAKLPSMMGRH